MSSAAPAIIEWYRADEGRRIRRALITGSTILTLGACVMGGSFLTHQPDSVRKLVAILGMLTTISGGLVVVIGMARALAKDAYVVVDAAGLKLKLESSETFLAWSDLARVHFDAARDAVVFTRREGDDLVTWLAFAGMGRKELAARLDTFRRRADFGMLRA